MTRAAVTSRRDRSRAWIDAHVGGRIAARRRQLGLAQHEVARAVGIGPRTLAAYEIGARRPTGPQLIGLADTLGVGVSYFFGGLAEPPKSPAAERVGDGETAARPGFGRSLALGSFVVAFGGSAAAQVKRIAIARSRSLAFLPVMVMQDRKLVEKHARAAGLGALSVSYLTFNSAASANDALLSGQVQIVAANSTAFLTLWDRTRANLGVRALSALSRTPSYLVTRNSRVRSVADFGEEDRINVFAPRLTLQAIVLQMAAAKAFGFEHYGRLDPLTVGLPATQSSIELITGAGELTADFCLPPFSYEELRVPHNHLVLTSDEVLGGPVTSTLMYTTREFHERDPEAVRVVTTALNEAFEFIREHRGKASEAFIRVGDGRMTPALRQMIDDPRVTYEPEPRGLTKFVDFMYRTGALRSAARDWQEFFFEPEAAALSGD